MSEGIGEATQIVKVTMEGTELFIKTAYMTIKEIAALIIAYKSYKDKTLKGEIELSKLLKVADGDVRMLRIPEDKKETVAEALKKYQIKFSLMEDLNLKDGKCEFAFAVTDLPRVNSVVEALKLGEVITNAEYIQNAEKEIIDKLADNIAEKENAGEKKELATGLVADLEGKELITISKQIVEEENEKEYKTRVPGTWGENVRYLRVPKEKIKEIHNGKTILTYLENDKDYALYSQNGEITDTVRGG